MSRQAVLIFSDDSLSAALLGAAAELAGLAPHFPQTDEPARNALLRVRPRLVLVDCDHAETCTDSFVGPALMTGARILMVRSPRTKNQDKDFVRRLGLRVIEMPTEHASLTRLMLDAIGE